MFFDATDTERGDFVLFVAEFDVPLARVLRAVYEGIERIQPGQIAAFGKIFRWYARPLPS